MSTTLLRLGLWTVILVLVLYVLATTYPDQPWAELIPMLMLQQALTVGGILVAAGVAARGAKCALAGCVGPGAGIRSRAAHPCRSRRRHPR